VNYYKYRVDRALNVKIKESFPQRIMIDIVYIEPYA